MSAAQQQSQTNLLDLLQDIKWEAVAAAAGVASAVLVLVSFLFLAAQIRQARKAAIAQTFMGIVATLQDQEMRDARGRVFALRGVDPTSWTQDHIRDIEKVCQSYDTVGMLCRYRLVPIKMVVDNWRDSLIGIWEICRPYVHRIRAERSAPQFWEYFESLVDRARGSRSGR